MRSLLVLLLVSLLGTGCASTRQRDTVMQLSTIDALLAGAYDGDITCKQLLQHGSFGIGTFHGLDGEMVVNDGHVFQVKADGKVYTPDLSVKTPFAAVCHFNPELSFPIPNALNYQGIRELLDQQAPNMNIFYGIRIKGTFSLMHTRSVPAQKKPYPPLADVAKRQPEFRMKNVSGVIVGFRCPPYVKGIGVPGYHLHFLSDAQDSGGHILGFTIDSGEVELDLCNRFYLVLPNDGSLESLDLSTDRSGDLMEVESR